MIPGESTSVARELRRRRGDGVSATSRHRDAIDASMASSRGHSDAIEAVSRRRPCRAGENTIPYNEEFRLFLTTKMPNPHYSPEVQVKISLVNFTVTQSGLEEQLLGATVRISVSRPTPSTRSALLAA